MEDEVEEDSVSVHSRGGVLRCSSTPVLKDSNADLAVEAARQ